MAVSEMLLANPDVWDTQKTRMRMDHSAEGGLRSVQIAGADPEMMAFAARYNVEQGAQIVDINMGCPAKKVNKKLAGSALLRQPDLVRSICRAVVDAVEVPVTLKIRTGWDPDNRNGEEIARIAEDCGIAALAVHGRTRACLYKGEAGTTLSGRLSRPYRFLLSPMATSIARRKPGMSSTIPVSTP